MKEISLKQRVARTAAALGTALIVPAEIQLANAQGGGNNIYLPRVEANFTLPGRECECPATPLEAQHKFSARDEKGLMDQEMKIPLDRIEVVEGPEGRFTHIKPGTTEWMFVQDASCGWYAEGTYNGQIVHPSGANRQMDADEAWVYCYNPFQTTATPTVVPSAIPTNTEVATLTPNPTTTNSPTPPNTPSATSTEIPSALPSTTSSSTPTEIVIPTASQTSTSSATPRPSDTASPSPTASDTLTPRPTASNTPSITFTPQSTATASVSCHALWYPLQGLTEVATGQEFLQVDYYTADGQPEYTILEPRGRYAPINCNVRGMVREWICDNDRRDQAAEDFVRGQIQDSMNLRRSQGANIGGWADATQEAALFTACTPTPPARIVTSTSTPFATFTEISTATSTARPTIRINPTETQVPPRPTIRQNPTETQIPSSCRVIHEGPVTVNNDHVSTSGSHIRVQFNHPGVGGEYETYLPARLAQGGRWNIANPRIDGWEWEFLGCTDEQMRQDALGSYQRRKAGNFDVRGYMAWDQTCNFSPEGSVGIPPAGCATPTPTPITLRVAHEMRSVNKVLSQGWDGKSIYLYE